ncbi:hypothetical protein D3C84_346480 [compost metagenome]
MTLNRDGEVVCASQLCVVLADSLVFRSNGGIGRSLPSQVTDHSFQIVHQPVKLREGVGHSDHRNAHGHFRSLWQTLECQRQIPDIMQFSNNFHSRIKPAQIACHTTSKAVYNKFLLATEEVIPQFFNFLYSSLCTYPYKLTVIELGAVAAIDFIATRSQVAVYLGGAICIHGCMAELITIGYAWGTKLHSLSSLNTNNLDVVHFGYHIFTVETVCSVHLVEALCNYLLAL